MLDIICKLTRTPAICWTQMYSNRLCSSRKARHRYGKDAVVHSPNQLRTHVLPVHSPQARRAALAPAYPLPGWGHQLGARRTTCPPSSRACQWISKARLCWIRRGVKDLPALRCATTTLSESRSLIISMRNTLLKSRMRQLSSSVHKSSRCLTSSS